MTPAPIGRCRRQRAIWRCAAALASICLLWAILSPATIVAESQLAGTEIDQNIAADMMWTLAGSPYIITRSGGIAVLNGATVTVQAGVVVKFDSQRMIRVESGKILVQGTAQQPVSFQGTQPDRGWWGGVAIGPGDTGSSFSYARFAHAGFRYIWADKTHHAALCIADTHVTIADCEFRHSARSGIELVRSNSSILRCTFTQVGEDASRQDIECDGDSWPTISGNTFNGGQPHALRVHAGALPGVKGNFFNGRAILVTKGTVDRSVTWDEQGAAFHEIGGNVTIAGPTSPVLTIPPGAELRFRNSVGIYVGSDAEPGALQAVGSWAPIRFTRAEEDTARWSGIFFDELADVVNGSLRNVEISYGGRDQIWHGEVWNGNINVYRSSPLIQECDIHHSYRYGLECSESSPNVRYNTFHDNGSQSAHYDILANGEATPTVRWNTFGAGNPYALRLSPTAMDNVRDNTIAPGRGISINGGTVASSITWRQQGADHYFITNGVLVAGAASPTLTIQPGQELRFDSDAELQIATEDLPGALDAVGPITFTRAASAGNWPGILLDAECDPNSTRMSGIVVEYGGIGQVWHEVTWYAGINI